MAEYNVSVGYKINVNLKGILIMKKFLSLVISAFLALTLLTGCAENNSGGTVSTDGSTSMEKVIGALGEAFEHDNDGVTFTYNPTGSGTGIQAVIDGRCDIGLPSRDLKEDEKNKGLIETVLAYDRIAVIVNSDNPVSDMSVETIYKIYTGEITNWKEIGGQDGEIVLIGREAGSGTRDGFESVTKTENACKYRQELTSTGDVVTTVAGNPNAIGIPQEHLERVFERFYRVDKSHSKESGGTGLGLSIVKHAAAYHNGTVSIQSEVGKGTKIQVDIPL